MKAGETPAAGEMSELSKIARQRLEALQQTAGDHPDADLLGALAEQRLSGEERERVLGHLAQCVECREVAALAAPREEPTQTVVRPVRRRFWLFQPSVLRWGAVAASVAVVAIAVSLYLPKGQPSVAVMAEKAAATPSQPLAQAEVGKGEAAETKQQASGNIVAPEKEKKLEARAKSALPSARAEKDEGVARGQFTAGALAKAAPGEVMGGQAAKPAAPQPTMTAEGAAGRTEAAPGAKADTTTAQKAAQTPAQNEPAAETADKLAMKRAAPAPAAAAAATVEVQAMNAAPAQAAMAAKREPATTQRVPALWSISNEGAVQASYSQGASWSKVNIAKDVRFLAVSALGSEVWAGGSGGALYHSSDAGRSWSRVPLGTDEDIVRVEFKDAQHGTVITSPGKQWVTEDGGKRWEESTK